jgi:hypothetical protein
MGSLDMYDMGSHWRWDENGLAFVNRSAWEEFFILLIYVFHYPH